MRRLHRRGRNSRLTAAALIISVRLIASNFIATLLIPPEEFVILIDELAALAYVNERDIGRRIKNALLGLWTAFRQSGGHHDHQVGERPPVGLATPMANRPGGVDE